MSEGEFDCIKTLMIPVEQVIKEGEQIKNYSLEEQVDLWNRIVDNQKKYSNGDCGHFFQDLDDLYRSKFDIAKLIISIPCNDNNNNHGFTEKEMALYTALRKYAVFDQLTDKSIREKLMSNDETMKALLRDLKNVDELVTSCINEQEIRPTIQYYVGYKYDGYKNKINKSINWAIKNCDWFGHNYNAWQRQEADLTALIHQQNVQIDDKDTMIQGYHQENISLNEQIAEILMANENAKYGTNTIESRLVTADEVDQYELNFINRMKRKLKEFDNNSFITINNIRYDVSLDEVTGHELDRYIQASLMENSKSKGLFQRLFSSFQRRKAYNIIALCVSRVEKLKRDRFDTSPLTLEELNSYIKKYLDQARNDQIQILLCLASPTGFSNKVVDSIKNNVESHKTFNSDLLCICLLDLNNANLYYNENDTIAKDFSSICKMESEKEIENKFMASVQAIIDKYMNERNPRYVTLKEILLDMESEISNEDDKSIIRRVFDVYAHENEYSTRNIDEIGYTMIEKRDSFYN